MTTLFTIVAILTLLYVLGTLRGIKNTEEAVVMATAGLFSGLIVAAITTAAVVLFANIVVLVLAIFTTAAGILVPIYGWKETTLEDYTPVPRGGHMNSGW